MLFDSRTGVDALSVPVAKFRPTDHISWSRNGSLIAMTGETHVDGVLSSGVTVIDVIMGSIVYSVSPWDARNDMLSVSWSYGPTNTLAVGRADGTLALYEGGSGKSLNEIRVCQHKLWSVAWSPFNVSKLAIGASDGIARIFDVNSGSIDCELKGFRVNVWSATWSQHDPNLVAFFDGSTHVLDVTREVELFDISSSSLNTARTVQWTDNPSTLITAEARGILVITLNKPLTSPSTPKGAIDNHRRRSLILSSEPNIPGILRDVPTSQSRESTVLTSPDLRTSVTSLLLMGKDSPISPRGNRRSSLRGIEPERVLKLANVELKPHDKVWWVSDGKYLVVQGEEGNTRDSMAEKHAVVTVIAADSGRQLCQIRGSRTFVVSAVEPSKHADNAIIAIGYRSGIVRLYDLITGSVMQSVSVSSARICSLAWSPLHCDDVACADAEGSVSIVHARSAVISIKFCAGMTPIWSMVWSSSAADSIAVLDGNLHVFNTEEGEAQFVCEGVSQNRAFAKTWSDASAHTSQQASDFDGVQLLGMTSILPINSKALLDAPAARVASPSPLHLSRLSDNEGSSDPNLNFARSRSSPVKNDVFQGSDPNLFPRTKSNADSESSTSSPTKGPLKLLGEMAVNKQSSVTSILSTRSAGSPVHMSSVRQRSALFTSVSSSSLRRSSLTAAPQTDVCESA